MIATSRMAIIISVWRSRGLMRRVEACLSCVAFLRVLEPGITTLRPVALAFIVDLRASASESESVSREVMPEISVICSAVITGIWPEITMCGEVESA